MSRRCSHSWSKQLLFSQISCFPSHPFIPVKLSKTEPDMSLWHYQTKHTSYWSRSQTQIDKSFSQTEIHNSEVVLKYSWSRRSWTSPIWGLTDIGGLSFVRLSLFPSSDPPSECPPPTNYRPYPNPNGQCPPDIVGELTVSRLRLTRAVHLINSAIITSIHG